MVLSGESVLAVSPLSVNNRAALRPSGSAASRFTAVSAAWLNTVASPLGVRPPMAVASASLSLVKACATTTSSAKASSATWSCAVSASVNSRSAACTASSSSPGMARSTASTSVSGRLVSLSSATSLAGTAWPSSSTVKLSADRPTSGRPLAPVTVSWAVTLGKASLSTAVMATDGPVAWA